MGNLPESTPKRIKTRRSTPRPVGQGVRTTLVHSFWCEWKVA